MSPEDQEIVVAVYVAMMRADKQGFEGSSAALRQILLNMMREPHTDNAGHYAFAHTQNNQTKHMVIARAPAMSRE